MRTSNEVLLILLVALVPSLATGFLGQRAIANEQAALEREAKTELSAEAEQAVGLVRDALEQRSKQLTTLADKVELTSAQEQLGQRLEPPFTLVSLSPSLSVLSSAKGAKPEPTAQCKSARAELVRSRAQAARVILKQCELLQDERERFLWPALALDELSRQADAELEQRLADWLRKHGGELHPAERQITAREIDGLRTSGKLRGEMVVLANDTAAQSKASLLAERTALRDAAKEAQRSSAVVRFSDGESLGVIRALSSGELLALASSRSDLSQALKERAAGFSALSANFEATLVNEEPAASLTAPIGFARLDKTLGVAVRHKNPRTLAERSASSERLLYGLIATGVLLGFGLAGLLYARVRKARRTSELRTTFVAGVSHELRTPLASLRMLSELLAEGRVEPDEQGEVFSALNHEAKRMSETVERFMIYARTDKGVLSARLEQAELAALVRRVAAAFERRHTGVTLTLELPEQLEVLIDAALLETALENLLENAQKYGSTPQGFELTLSADTKQILLSVRDFGPGVAPAARERIFRAFERGDARLSKATSGTGLGLFLVRAIAQAHGGEVKLLPKQPGCSFELRLPRQNVQPAAGEESAP